MGLLATIVELGGNDALYGILLLLHILCAILGFGPLMLNGLYGAEAKKRPGPGGAAIGQANFAVSMVAEYFVYAVFVLGVLLVLVSENDVIGFGDTWVWLSMLLYLVGMGISHGVQMPSAKRMNVLAEELASGPPPSGDGPPPQVAEMEALGKKLDMGGATLSVLLVVILFLMIWKPGFP
jgi:hypothetical protein